MKNRAFFWSFIIQHSSFIILLQPAQAQVFDDFTEPPVVGQPEHFSGAVGTSYQASLHATPAEVRVGEPLTLTLRIQATGPWRRPPSRLLLEQFKGFEKDRFRIDRSASDRPDRELPVPRPHWTIDRRLRPPRPIDVRDVPAQQRTWEFDYQVRPLSESIDQIPAVPLAYYRPPRNPALPGSFPTTFAEPIPIKVLPRLVAKRPPVKIEAPAGFLRVESGSKVLDGQGVFRLPAWPLVFLLLLLPPLAGVGWYLAWLRLFPDAAQQARRRQSRAARLALAALAKVKADAGPEQARQVSEILAEYLRHRFGLPGLEPTPTEVGQFLARVGIKPDLAERMASLFSHCDAIRFAPEPPAGTGDLAATARELVVGMEEDTDSPQRQRMIGCISVV